MISNSLIIASLKTFCIKKYTLDIRGYANCVLSQIYITYIEY